MYQCRQIDHRDSTAAQQIYMDLIYLLKQSNRRRQRRHSHAQNPIQPHSHTQTHTHKHITHWCANSHNQPMRTPSNIHTCTISYICIYTARICTIPICGRHPIIMYALRRYTYVHSATAAADGVRGVCVAKEWCAHAHGNKQKTHNTTARSHNKTMRVRTNCGNCARMPRMVRVWKFVISDCLFICSAIRARITLSLYPTQQCNT